MPPPSPTLLVIATVGACVSRLWSLELPSTPVYDETHVGRFLNWYHDRAFFFDVHGPLAKLLMYWTATALGFDGKQSCPYESAAPYAASCTLAPQRLVPAICGACMVPLIFITCCSMRLHPFAALLCTWFVLVDTLWLGLSRVHLNDMILMLFIGLTHLFALRACATPSEKEDEEVVEKKKKAKAEDDDKEVVDSNDKEKEDGDATSGSHPPSLSSALLHLCATGVALGCALQSKYAMALTTLAWLGLQNLETLGVLWRLGVSKWTLLREALQRGLLLLGIPIALHIGLFALHMSYLPNTGNGDNYLNEKFQSTLKGNKHYGRKQPGGVAPTLLELAAEHLSAQFWYNRNMAILFPRGSHPFDSPWYTWPIAGKGVYFGLVSDWEALSRDVGGKHSFGIYLHPNPMIVLTTTAAVVAAAGFLLVRAGVARRHLTSTLRPGAIGSLLAAYLLHWLPYATQSRQTFLLYYLPAYYFAILIFGRVWHALVCTYLRPTVAALMSLALAAWVGHVSWILAPLAYGSKVRLHEWTDALVLASTECWGERPCWVSDARD